MKSALALLCWLAVLSGAVAIRKNSAHVLANLKVKNHVTVTEATSCFYTLYLRNSEGLGFNGASVQVYANGVAAMSSAATLPEGLHISGWTFDVTEGQTISAVYTPGKTDNGTGLEFWMSDANSNNVLYQSSLSGNMEFTLSDPVSCDCTYLTSSCPAVRMRSEWRAMSFCDQRNFISSIVTLRTVNNGTDFNFFTLTHAKWAWTLEKAGFYTWHRRFSTMYEDALRNLGGQYSCVVLPYWDWSLDFGMEGQSSIYDSFGGLKTDSCLDAPFDTWTNPAHWDMCVRRRTHTESSTNADPYYVSMPFTSDAAFQYGITSNNTFKHLSYFFARAPHSSVHVEIAGSNMGDFLMSSAPADPLFFLHHTNIDRSWALWQDCWDYDLGSPANWAEQYEDLSTKQNMNISSVFPALGGTAYDVIDLTVLGVRYTPMWETWHKWGTSNAKCNWNWFSATETGELDFTHKNLAFPVHTRYRAPVHTDYQRDMLSQTALKFNSVMETSNSYETALTAKLTLECSLGDYDSKDASEEHFDVRACGGNLVVCLNMCSVNEDGLLAEYAQKIYLPATPASEAKYRKHLDKGKNKKQLSRAATSQPEAWLVM